MTDWTSMPQFQAMDLTESFVLGWSNSGDLVFDVEFCLLPEHDFYRPPAPDEWACFVRGRLRFPSPKVVLGFKPPSDVRAATDSTGESDYGNFEEFALGQNGYVVVGEFGTFTVAGTEPRVELDEAG